ncbi:MAG: gamma-glutamylcyclotransferase [Sphingobacteriales bacterium]|nr:gamma-glutamylcyclotransferase [Sphingobacteriales bacterium]
MTSKGVYNLFVYGSLRSGFQSPAYEYISRFFTLTGSAKVKGRLYDLGTYPAGVPTDDDTYITGELYRVSEENEFSWAMGQLDDYEGVDAEAEEERLYRRDIADVYCDGQTVKAWIYWYNGDVSGRPDIASGDMMDYLNSKRNQ